jgi:outer membrane immunogenic protein
MHCNSTRKITLFNALLAFGALAATGLVPIEDARAQSGLYAGLSAGSATIEDEIPDENLDEVFTFDENDFAWKAFGGYKIDIPAVPLAVEFGYVDLGSPSGDFLGSSVAVDVTGWNLVGLIGVQLGPVGLFAKGGVISWNLDATVDGIQAGDDDGTDPTYGVGARFNLGSLELRGEYELFDLDSVDDVYLLSLGVVFGF